MIIFNDLYIKSLLVYFYFLKILMVNFYLIFFFRFILYLIYIFNLFINISGNKNLCVFIDRRIKFFILYF